MSYEIIVLDLDGTLTNSEKVISGETKEALFDAQELGKKVVLASGRPTAGIVRLAQELKLGSYGGYILSFNGARILQCQTQQVIYNKTVPEDLILPIYEQAVKLNIGILTYTEQEILLGNGVDQYNQMESKINKIPMREVDDFPSQITFPVNKFLLTGKPEDILHAMEVMVPRFEKRLNIYRSEPYFLEIMPPRIDKAYSLSVLLAKLGLSKEQMICCGDGFNDLSMIRFAGLGVAMANAQEEVMEAADYITFSNDEDGVAHVVKKFMLKTAV